MRRALALLLISAAAVVAVPAIASGGGGPEVDLDLVSPKEPLTFEAKFDNGTCVEGEFKFDLTANGNEVVPISATQDAADPDRFVFVLPSDTPPGVMAIEIECDDGEEGAQASDSQEWAALAVTKVVSGPAAADAAFTVHVDCIGAGSDGVDASDISVDFDADLQYGAAGGVHYVYSDHEASCTITEPVNGGATSVSIVQPVVDLDDNAAFTATVTNTFPAAAVVIQPTFTG